MFHNQILKAEFLILLIKINIPILITKTYINNQDNNHLFDPKIISLINQIYILSALKKLYVAKSDN